MQDDATSESEQRRTNGAAHWVTLAAVPLFFVALTITGEVAEGPHVHDATWFDGIGAFAVFALFYFLPMFVAGVTFEQWRDARRR